MEQRRLGLADIAAQRAIARRQPRLPLQLFELLRHLRDDVLDALEVLLGRPEPQFRLVPPRMQAGNARRLFEQRARCCRLGRDQLADLALPHEGREWAPVEASANSSCTSRARTSLPLTR